MPARHLLSVGDDAVPASGHGGRISGWCKRESGQRPEPRSQVYNADLAFIAARAACRGQGRPRAWQIRPSKFTLFRATGP
jgi:hypothetical protein